jgi:hypothetical protein
MLAYKLEVVVYPDAGYSWHSEVITDPTWEQIENAIRDLDRAEYPFIHICLPSGREESEVRSIDVIGGEGEYGISGIDKSGQERWRFRDPTRPNGPGLIDIWVTDQGASFEEAYLCNDLSVVLRICRQFAEVGELTGDVLWETRNSSRAPKRASQ